MWHRQLLEAGEPPSLGQNVEPLPPGRRPQAGGSQEGRGAEGQLRTSRGCPSRSAPSSSGVTSPSLLAMSARLARLTSPSPPTAASRQVLGESPGPRDSTEPRHQTEPKQRLLPAGRSAGASCGSTLRSGAKFSHLANWRRNEQFGSCGDLSRCSPRTGPGQRTLPRPVADKPSF